MTVDELANRELKLYNAVSKLTGTIEDKVIQIKRLGISDGYQRIHKEYAKLNKTNLEALKRGLFLIWYSRSEPSFLTGIVELDSESEIKIIKTLDRRLRQNVTDYELDWMIDYYSTWDFLFQTFSEYKFFQDRLKRTVKTERPETFDNDSMSGRGQMGIYWNSLNKSA